MSAVAIRPSSRTTHRSGTRIRRSRSRSNARDNLTQVTNARHIVLRRYQYDRNDRLIRELLPDDSALEHRYDPSGNLIETRDAKGQRILYLYDADNRLTTVRHFAAGTPGEEAADAEREITFSYDALDRLTGYDDGHTRAQYQHDGAGRLLGASVDYGAFTAGFRYTYYANGLKRTYTGPDGITLTYSYNPNGELTSVSIPGQGTYSVDAYRWSAPTRVTLPGGGQRRIDRDGYLRPHLIEGLDPAANPVQQDAYTHDKADNILSRQTLRGPYAYGYDPLDRLTEVDGATEQNAYAYDPVGNRLSEQAYTDASGLPHDWEYDDADRLTRRGPISYEYDANGNLIREPHADTGSERRYRYNVDNRLIEVRNQADTLIASYAYDPFGRRVQKTVGTTTTYYLYAEEGMVAELDATGSVTTGYGWKPHGIWGTDPLFIRQGGVVGYYHNDHLGTPQAVTSASGVLLWSARYDAFGKAVVDTAQITNNLRFPGQYFDAETGLHYNYFRYYDSGLGRYLKSDPIGLKGGRNTYIYANANPIRHVDVFGLKTDMQCVQDANDGFRKCIDRTTNECISLCGEGHVVPYLLCHIMCTVPPSYRRWREQCNAILQRQLLDCVQDDCV
ncbi:RHS domain-containing protein [Ectothiorhodospiraceae bacterium 2226]|nr:RHS domain-containing protein [Ectothiorhodospiraceae bacterium 2226]